MNSKQSMCPHCGVLVETTPTGGRGRFLCPACHREVVSSNSVDGGRPASGEVLDQHSHRANYQAARSAAIAVFLVSLVVGLIVFFQAGLTIHETSIREMELILLTTLGVASALVWVYSEIAMKMKSRH